MSSQAPALLWLNHSVSFVKSVTEMKASWCMLSDNEKEQVSSRGCPNVLYSIIYIHARVEVIRNPFILKCKVNILAYHLFLLQSKGCLKCRSTPLREM